MGQEGIHVIIHVPCKGEVKIEFSLMVNTVDSMLWSIPRTQISTSSVESILFSHNNTLKELSVCLSLAPFDYKV